MIGFVLAVYHWFPIPWRHFEGNLLLDTLQHSILDAWLAVTQAGFPPARQSELASPHLHHMVARSISVRFAVAGGIVIGAGTQFLLGKRPTRVRAAGAGTLIGAYREDVQK